MRATVIANWPITNALRKKIPLPDVVNFPFKIRMGLNDDNTNAG